MPFWCQKNKTKIKTKKHLTATLNSSFHINNWNCLSLQWWCLMCQLRASECPHPEVAQQVIRFVQAHPVGRVHGFLIQQRLLHLGLLLVRVVVWLWMEKISFYLLWKNLNFRQDYFKKMVKLTIIKYFFKKEQYVQ